MNRFTITPEFLEASAMDEGYYYFSNVLMVFAQRNSYKLCLDNRGFASQIYEEIIRKHECLRVWMKAMNCKPHCIENVSIPRNKYEDRRDLFLSIANEVQPLKQLITNSKSLYNNKKELITLNKISLLDGDEAIDILQMKTPQMLVQISYGNNSPNINGNNNKV